MSFRAVPLPEVRYAGRRRSALPGSTFTKLGFAFRDFAQHILDQALPLHGIRIVGDLRDRLGKRHHDLVGIDDVRFAARRAIFPVEFVDQVADQAVQARPFVFRFRVIRHGRSFSEWVDAVM